MSDNSNSIAVRQFVAIVRGEISVHVPRNEFQTVQVGKDERYCLRCCAVRVWDLWRGKHEGLEFLLGRCRACGLEKTL